MTHLVSPITFRLGKSLLWKSNAIIKNSVQISRANILLSSTSFNGITALIKHKLRRQRLLVAKTNLFYQKQILNCHVMFMPRIKTRPIFDGKGIFSRHVLYKPYNWKLNFQKCAKSYVDQRRLKIFKFPKKKNKLINKWLSRRMLRGSNLLHNWRPKFLSYYANKPRYAIKKIKKIKYNTRWHISRLKMPLANNSAKLSHFISNTLNQNCNVIAVNIFSYLAFKQMIGFRSHQEHLWNSKFRKHRFFYDNYYDIVNSLFVLSLIKNSETLLLDILRLMMPRIRKIKRFMMFIDSVLKNMPQIQIHFWCFRIIVVGKIRGGTQRTKTLSVGFGHLPYQSLHIEGTTSFISYPHKYGEFGVKLIMSRNLKIL